MRNILKKKYNIAIIQPPIEGHKYRGTGIYTIQLLEALKKIEEIDITLINTKDDFSSFDLIHYPYFDPFFLTLFYIKRPMIVTVHDLIPLKFPDYFPPGIKGKLKWLIQKNLLQSCRGIITDSYVSKEDIMKIAKIKQEKIHVVYLGVNDQFRVIRSNKLFSDIKKKYGLYFDFFLHVGDVNYNKNIKRLIEAFRMILDKYPALHLVLIGKGFIDNSIQLSEIKKLIKNLKISDRIVYLCNIEDKDLVGIFNLASAYIQPSLAEGFGLPVLEAMSCGCPVVASNCSSIAEIAGDAYLAVDPYNTKDIANGCVRILSDCDKRENFIKMGLERAKKFNWEKTAKQTVAVYKKILKG